MALEFTCVADLHCRIGEEPRLRRADEPALFRRYPEPQDLCLRAFDRRALPSWSFESEVGSMGLTASGALVVALRHSVILFDPDERAARRSLHDRGGGRGEDASQRRTRRAGRRVLGRQHGRPAGEGADRGALPRRSLGTRWSARWKGSSSPTASPGRRTARSCSTPIRAGPGSTAGASTARPARCPGATRFAAPDDTVGRPDGGSLRRGRVLLERRRLRPAGSTVSPPTARLVDSFVVPVPAPTMPCFGGEDFRTLYLTNLTEGRAPEALAKAPAAGGLLAAALTGCRFPVLAVP